jgi:hypothetical protein
MGELVLEGLNPLYLKNPEVKPVEYKDWWEARKLGGSAGGH